MRVSRSIIGIKFWLVLLLYSVNTLADNTAVILEIKPKRCIALHKGQTCYQTLRFSWTTPQKGDYCLFQLPNSTPLLCWSGNEKTFHKEEFKSDKNLVYQIRSKGQDKALAEARVQVAWVYKSSKKSSSGWRLF